MEEGGHQHAHRPHGTGFHWLDISLALSAFVVSLASLWLTVHNARTMEKLVASNSYPNIDFSFGNQFDFQDGQGLRHAVYLSLENTGVGPARLRSIELSFAGRPVNTVNGFKNVPAGRRPRCARCSPSAARRSPRGRCRRPAPGPPGTFAASWFRRARA